nr:hypothetical protein [Mesorhizobium prunaredense]
MTDRHAAEYSFGEGAEFVVDHVGVDSGQNHLALHDHKLLSPVSISIKAMFASKDGGNVPDPTSSEGCREWNQLGCHSGIPP